MFKHVMVLAIALAAALPALGQMTVVCESSDGRYRECDISGPGRVIVTRQISDTNCVEGKNWGVRDGKVWVNEGCRAEFALTERGFMNRGDADQNKPQLEPVRRMQQRTSINDIYLTCESLDNKRTSCPIDTRQGVRFVRKLSDSTCIQGTDWGFDSNGIWVANGCRGEFAVTYDVVGLGLEPASFSRLACESVNNKRNHCRADTSRGVQLSTQLSDSDCDLGRTWGYDRDGVWVTNGCRGVFTLLSTRAPMGMMSSSSVPGPTVICESQNNGRNHCAAETRFGVMLSRRISDSSCDFRRDWGFDENGIWVNNGCRAEFVLDNDR